MTFNLWLICLRRGTERGNTFPFTLTEHSYQWLWGQREVVNLLSSFCCLPWWVLWSHLWQQVSVDTWFMSPVSFKWLPLPQAASGAQQPRVSLVVPDLIVPFPQRSRHRIHSDSETKAVKASLACTLRCVCRCVLACIVSYSHALFVQQCFVLSSNSFCSLALYKLGFYGPHSGPDTNYANY